MKSRMMFPEVRFSRRVRGVFLSALVVMAVLPTRAQTPPATPPPASLTGYTATVTNFFELDRQMKYKEAADCLLNSNPSDVGNATMHEQLFTALDGLHQKFGDFKKYAVVIDKKLGADIAYVYGIALYDKGGARFEFIFAREDNGWQMMSVSYSLNIAEELRGLAGLPPQTVHADAK